MRQPVCFFRRKGRSGHWFGDIDEEMTGEPVDWLKPCFPPATQLLTHLEKPVAGRDRTDLSME
jgi:hypothetical protein